MCLNTSVTREGSNPYKEAEICAYYADNDFILLPQNLQEQFEKSEYYADSFYRIIHVFPTYAQAQDFVKWFYDNYRLVDSDVPYDQMHHLISFYKERTAAAKVYNLEGAIKKAFSYTLELYADWQKEDAIKKFTQATGYKL